MRHEIVCGDSLQVLPTLDANSIDAIVTDPPYELGLLNRGWDNSGIAFSIDLWRAALRVAKPGAHLLAFGGTRTVHRLMVAIEDAGWEIRDLLCWAYAQGMPKDGDLSVEMDRLMGAKREVVGERTVTNANLSGRAVGATDESARGTIPVTGGPVSDEAKRAEGWSTTLKPAWEPIVMARKPMRQSVARNFLQHGTGALNIDATRLPVAEDDPMRDAIWTSRPSAIRPGTTGWITNREDGDRNPAMSNQKGRWPANVILTDDVFDWTDAPEVVGAGPRPTPGNIVPVERRPHDGSAPEYGAWGASGTMSIRPEPRVAPYSRFFLVPKASRSDREPDMDALTQLGVQPEMTGLGGSRTGANAASRCTECGLSQPFAATCSKCGAETEPYFPGRARVNTHPTVKPQELLRHLIRMVTPPGGIVLDPFAGSGTTGLVADQEGFDWVMIEMDRAHVEMARVRLLGTQRGLGL